MSSRRSIPRRRQRSGTGEDSDEPDSAQASPPSSSKRPRLSPAQDEESESDASPSDDADQSDATGSSEEPSTQAPAQRATVHHGVGPGGYKPGAIVRIKVTNFVTYTSAEFFPGPKLNMVIGPNGTGKSTLVCAICLGLGWGPQHLGRAKDLGEFVKHGCAEAQIEIELSGPPKISRNPVIRRTIKRDGNKSSFTLNNTSVSRSAVLKLAQSFAIQVDNLCQFLPQDKVAEFAALTPIELLYSTQRAAAGPEMIEWHDALKKLRAGQKKLEIDNRADQEVLTNLENRQEMQRADVERMRQRADIQQKIDNLEFLRPVVQYKDYHKTFEALKEKKARLEQEHEQLKADLEPAMRALTAKQSYIEQINHVRDHRDDKVKRLSETAEQRRQGVEALEASIKDLNGQIEAQRKSGQKHKTEAATTQQSINRLKRQLEEEAVEFDPDYYNEQLRAKRLEKRDLEAQAAEIKGRRQPITDEAREVQKRYEEAERQLKNLDSQSGRQELKLHRASPDSLKAYQWLLGHQDRFENEVFGPPMMTCSITDPKYADVIETLFQKADFLSFTVQSKKDFKTLQKALIEELGLWDINMRTCALSLESLRSPYSTEELQSRGFDGWAKDYLRGPAPVLAMLCSENRLHQTPISLKDISDDTYAQMEKGPINSWVAGRNHYLVTRRREYGPDAQSTRVKQVRNAQVWTSQPVDVSLKQQYQETIQTCLDKKGQLEDQMQKEREAMAELRSAFGRVEEEVKSLENEKAEKQTAQTQYRALPEKIAQQQNKYENIQKLFEEVRVRVGEIRDEQDELAIQKSEASIQYADAVEKLREAFEELMQVEMRHLEATSDVQNLRYRSNDCAKMLEQKSQEVRQAVTEWQEGRAKGKLLMREAKKASEASHRRSGGPEVQESIRAPDYDMHKLDADIDSEKARLELTHGGSANMIKEFEERERQIQKLHSKLADFHKELTEFQQAINEVRGNWEPRLDGLVSKISDAFSDSFQRIGCAGQVSLDKVEDEAGGSEFDQWSIQIHVKFREHENLSLLDSHRQSGGERAVSTIFYLMALQSLSASPFRVVDEINQGMDPRNERMVHGRLVDIACASDDSGEAEDEGNAVGGGGGGQYFLITPKLLSGLVYKPGMRVLCIYSGEHMPHDHGKLDFGLAIRNMKAIAGPGGMTAGKGKARAVENNNHVDVYA